MKYVQIVASFFFNDTATTEIYTLSLHDALPILIPNRRAPMVKARKAQPPDKQPALVTQLADVRAKIGRAHV